MVSIMFGLLVSYALISVVGKVCDALEVIEKQLAKMKNKE